MSRIFHCKTNNRIDISKPPLGPPLREIGAILGIETKASRENTKAWDNYIKSYSEKCRLKGQP